MTSADIKADVKQEITGLVAVYLVIYYKKYLQNLEFNKKWTKSVKWAESYLLMGSNKMMY